MDPMEAEEQALDKLDAWAERTGVTADDKEYQQRLKYIKAKCLGDLKAAAADAGAFQKGKKVQKVNFDPIQKWATVGSAKHKDLQSAKTLLKKVEGAGVWKQDVGCARTNAEGGKLAYRFVNVVAVGGPYLARLVKESEDKWTVQKPIFEEAEKEEQEEVAASSQSGAAQEEATAPPEAAPAAAGKKSTRKRKAA